MHKNNVREESNCGYCKGKKETKNQSSWGIGSPRFSAADYEKLMDRGWRRCG
jgi:hypothetical protein